MNIFFTEPDRVVGNQFELTDQEARHAVKVLRLKEGDQIHATNGKGKRFTGKVQAIAKDSVTAAITETIEKPAPDPELVLGMGIIKKRDRLEFAVEKAVELGASKIVLFTSDHTIKTNVRMDRLENIVLSAMKQSLRAWLPEIGVFDSLEEVLASHKGCEVLMAHEKTEGHQKLTTIEVQKLLLLVGPEGGFSDREVDSVKDAEGELVSLGEYRLRAETAAVALLSRFG